MTQVSRYRLFEKEETEIKALFAEVISMLSSPNDISAFLDDFLTPTERIVLSKRITIALLLKQGCSYDVIKKTLKVSAPTVADVNLKLKYSGKGYHKILDRVLAEKKIKNIFDKLETAALEVLTIGRGKGTGPLFDRKLKKYRESSSII